MFLAINLIAFAKEGCSTFDAAIGLYMEYHSPYTLGKRADKCKELFDEYLTKAAEEGDTEAQYLYYLVATGRPYDGRFKSIGFADHRLNYSDALKYLKLAAKEGHKDAQFELGVVKYNGSKDGSIPEDELESMTIFKDLGPTHTGASYYLGRLYGNGTELTSPDYKEAIKWLKSAEKDDRYKWNSILLQAEYQFYGGNLQESSRLYDAYFKELKDVISDTKNHKFKARKSVPEVSFGMINYVQAAEAFALSKKDNSIKNLIECVDYIFESQPIARGGKEKTILLLEDYYYNENPEKVKQSTALPYLYKKYGRTTYFNKSLYYSHLNDYQSEIKVLEEGILIGENDCLYRMCLYNYYGLHGIKQDKAKARKFIQNISKRSLDRSEQLNVSFMEAMIYYDSEIGNDYKKACDAAYNFIDICRKINGVPDDLKGSIYHLLSKCYRFGRGVDENQEQADFYSKKAAACGNLSEQKMQQWLIKSTNAPNK